jgi:hypothetical protein
MKLILLPILGLFLAAPRTTADPPVRYCLTYPAGADSIRLAQTIELGLAGDSGTARSTAFPLDSMHTPRLLASEGRWRRSHDGDVSITFGGDAWQYVYDVRITRRALNGRVRVRTDMHLDAPITWAVTGRRCGVVANSTRRQGHE